MINLLPPGIKSEYKYAQRNTALVRWIVAFVVGIAGLGCIGAFGWFYMHEQATAYQSQIDSTKTTLDAEHYTQTVAQVKDITSSFKLVVQVLSQEVLFSQLLKQIATLMPVGTSLSNLNISNSQDVVVITANAVSYNAASQLQANLQDPANQIFASADTQSVSCTSGSKTTNKTYPCTIVINALLAKNTPFLFINQGVKQ